ncbi:MAG: mechanosensitive ion channel [Chloroflexi bacterium]|nr:mechanosensitive ion channel [Chloroflexota bacterium]
MPTFQEQLAEFAPRLIISLLVFIVFWLASILIEKLVINRLTKTRLNQAALKLIGTAIKIGLLVVAGIVVLAILGIDLNALVAGLGLTTLTLGIALREVVVNILAGILLLIDRPFRVNDLIIISGVQGTVQRINLRNTTLQYTTPQGEERRILIPNSLLLTNAVTIIKAPAPGPGQ